MFRVRHLKKVQPFPLLVFSDEATNRAIVGSFGFGGEEAAREFLHPPVIDDALTAFSFPFTTLICARALH